jgi:UDP:flavonoid glycosyltransferase YjiC (YdhE family)
MSGHLHPILGIGRRLARDHEVRVFSTLGAQLEIAAAGLEGRTVLTGADEVISSIVNPPYGVRSNPWRLHAQFKANLGLLEGLRAELLEVWSTSPPDLVIADFTVPAVASAATERGIPWWTATPSPVAMETRDGPPGYLGGWRPYPGPLGRLRDAAGRSLVRTFKRVVHRFHRTRLRRLGFPSVYRENGVEAIYSPECVLALSLEALEFVRGYPPAVEFVGPVLYSPPVDAPEPLYVAGRQHVLVTLGTHLGWRREAVVATVREAARHLPALEFHVSDGDRNSRRCESAGNVHRIGFVSYTRDLARYALVVHHGGAGVLSHTLAAGTPAIVLPIDFDQFDNAARLEAAGVAICPRRLGDLSRAITKALGDEAMRSASLRMQALLSTGNAEDRVAERVSRHFSVVAPAPLVRSPEATAANDGGGSQHRDAGDRFPNGGPSARNW